MIDFAERRSRMLAADIEARGVRDHNVLQAMARVRREAFVPDQYRPNAYDDRPLPIAGGQTISQPYIVAFMIEALLLRGGEKVLEIGAGSGYAAAVLAEIADQVYAIERVETLASEAAQRLDSEGYHNVQIQHADGTQGWIEHAPFDAILVSAGAPAVPETLKSQLAPGGRMVVPVGKDQHSQELVRVTRTESGRFIVEELADVRFVPLIGKEGWELDERASLGIPARVIQTRPAVDQTVPGLISRNSEPFEGLDGADLAPLLRRIGDARVVLIGEASHGSSEFYRMRARITKALVEEKGFGIVAAEADWPDAARIDQYVRHRESSPTDWAAFSRFPTWMWRNEEVRDFVDWLHEYNKPRAHEERTGFYGLDLYSLYSSVSAVIRYLEDVDPQLATLARNRYGCLSPWEADPAAYGRAALTGSYRGCEDAVVRMLLELQSKRLAYVLQDGERFLDASQNAQLVVDAERYYRVMYYGSRASWNLRDTHMYDTLVNVMKFRGEGARAVVWAHNSHIGDASATEMAARGEHNLGQLCREAFGANAYLIGFGTDHGTVAAASAWDGPLEIKTVRRSNPQSYERLFHRTGIPGLLLPLRGQGAAETIAALSGPRLERAIGVIYRPESELESHYFEAVLPRQFDEYIWFDETQAITPLPAGKLKGMPDTYPFGL